LQQFGSPTDVVLLLGMDDRLLPGCLERVATEYRSGKWMTYGNWINQNGDGLPKDFNLYFDEQTHTSRAYRDVTYRSTAPNTFYKFLFDAIPEDDFKIGGKWIDSTTESEVMFSCLEMCGKDRIGVIEEPVYLYNQHLPNGTIKRHGSKYKYELLDIIKARPKRKLLTDKDYEDMTNVSKTKWKKAFEALSARRNKGIEDNTHCEPIVADYGRHLRAVDIGVNVLDVGCGEMALRDALKKHSQYSGFQHQYTGIDAFPVSDEVVEMQIEECTFADKQFDTTICFAALDCLLDVSKALQQMKRVTSGNILILTGVGIEPDKFHTHKIEYSGLIEMMGPDWIVSMSNHLVPNVVLIEFKPAE